MTGKDLAVLISKHGQASLAEALGLSIPEISRKLAGHENHGWTLEQITQAFGVAGLRVVDDDADSRFITLPRDEVIALNLLAKRYLDRRVRGEGDEA